MSGIRVAMWSGPRNISTAMMRSWENRPDTHVIDEPLYAHYLARTGLDHPGRAVILASQSQDWRRVVSELTAPVPEGRIFYQKHMTHHVTPDVELDWLVHLRNVFLIRRPEEAVLSYGRVRGAATAEELGFPQQARIFDRVVETTGEIPPVIEARGVLENPRRVLATLCERLEVPFDERMLHWPAGARTSDGVWARWWYASVEKSTGFQEHRPKREPLSTHQRELADLCRPHYERLLVHRIDDGGG